MKPLPKTFLQKVNDLIEQQLDNPELLILLQQELQLSSSQIYRKIKAQTGFSPSLYIRQKRLQQAHLWIQETEMNIAEIAKRVGFKQGAYFSRCFSGYYGCSPRDLRKRGRVFGKDAR